MSLTVPQAGVIAGRSANTAVNEPGQLGAGLSDLGRAMLDVNARIKTERDELDMRRTQLTMARDMGQARLEVEQIGDPAQIGPTWEARKSEIRARYLALDDQGRPTIDPAKAEAYDLMFMDMDNRHAPALAEKAINLTRSQREAAWVEMRGQIETDALSADPETLSVYLEMADNAIDQRLAAGLISPEAAAVEKRDLKSGIYQNRANAAIEADPAAFLAGADAGAWNDLGADALAKGQLAAQSELNRREAEAAKEAERRTTAMDTAIKSRFADMTSIAKDGRKATDEAWLASPEVQARITANPELAAARAELEAARGLRDENPGLRQMNPAQLDALIAAEQKKPISQPYQAERLKVLIKTREDLAAKWQTNKVDAARAAGMAVPEVPAFDPANPEPYAKGIAERLAYDEALKAQGYGPAPGVLGADEKAQVDTVIDPKADTGPKLALAEAMVAGTRGKPDVLFRGGGLSGDDVFNHATAMLALTGDRQLASEIMTGGQKVALGTVNLPAEKQMTSVFDDLTGGLYEDNPKAKARVMAAARALYANSAAGMNPDGADSIIPFMDDTAAQDAYRVAVQRVTGATADANGDLTVGGVQDVRGTMTVLPPGVSVRAVEDSLDRIEDHLSGRVTGYDPNLGFDQNVSTEATAMSEAAPFATRMAALKAASIDGSIPDLGANAVANFRQTFLVPVPGSRDVYEMHYLRDGIATPLRRADGAKAGAAWRFRLPDLIRGGNP